MLAFEQREIPAQRNFVSLFLREAINRRCRNLTSSSFVLCLVLRGWLARRKYARLREVHQLQLVFIRKFCDDIALIGQLYKTKMDNYCQFDQKRKLKQCSQLKNEEDDEQIAKTMNFFDSILDQYLSDQDTPDDSKRKLPTARSRALKPA